MKVLLEVHQLTVCAGQKFLLNNVSFKAIQGRITALVGGSGSGKTTIANAILGLLPSDLEMFPGQIIFDNKDIRKFSPEQMRLIRGSAIAMIFQEPLWAFNPLMTIAEQIDEVLAVHTDSDKIQRKKRILDVLDKVQLLATDNMSSRYPHQLSGGQRQRAMIAQALAANPKLIIADEPTSSLDVTVQAKIMELFRQFKKEGMSMLLISHDLGMVMHLADDVIILEKGKVVESGPVSMIMQNPKHKYTRSLVEAFI